MFAQLDATEGTRREFIALDGSGVDHATAVRGGPSNGSVEPEAYTYMSSANSDGLTQFDASETESVFDDQEAFISSADVELFADLSEEDVTRLAIETYACDPRLFYAMERRMAIDDESTKCSNATYENHLRSFDICPSFADAARPIVVPPTVGGRFAGLYLGVKTRAEAERSLAGSMTFAMYHLWIYSDVFECGSTLPLYAVLRFGEKDSASHLAICMVHESKDATYHVEGMKRHFPTLNDLVEFYCLPAEECTEDIAFLQLATAVSCFSVSQSETERDFVEVGH